MNATQFAQEALARSTALAAFVIAFAVGGPAAAQQVGAGEAGARYGQALGAAQICAGWAVTDKAHQLAATYDGAERATFTDQTAKTLDAWLKVKNCVNQADPNRCKVSMDLSCTSAIQEIGPKGSAVAGLIAPAAK